jgi:parvulin-like peptidyl-prolyl isomerase
MRIRHVAAWVLMLGLVALPAWNDTAAKKGKSKEPEPDSVVVQHILISFKGKVDKSKGVTRTKKEAEALATELFERAKTEEFDALVKEYTDDAYPGIYKMTNEGAPIMTGAVPRSGMVTDFGDVAFSLAVGEIGMTSYSAGGSPYGWHIIKRLS